MTRAQRQHVAGPWRPCRPQPTALLLIAMLSVVASFGALGFVIGWWSR